MLASFWIVYFSLFIAFTKDPEHSFVVYSKAECEGCMPPECMVTAEPRNLPGEIDMGVFWRSYFVWVRLAYIIYAFFCGLTILLAVIGCNAEVAMMPAFICWLNLPHKLAVTIYGFAHLFTVGMVSKGTYQDRCEELYGEDFSGVPYMKQCWRAFLFHMIIVWVMAWLG